jgi:hypothetical protein
MTHLLPDHSRNDTRHLHHTFTICARTDRTIRLPEEESLVHASCQPDMPIDELTIAAASFHAYLIYDVADTIDLTRLVIIAGEDASRAPLRLRATQSPGHIQFADPPVVVPLSPCTVGAFEAQARAKIYDYGVVSIRFSFRYAGTWQGFGDLAAAVRRDETVSALADRMLREVLREYAPALVEPHATLVEDYYICTVERFATPVTATTLLTERAASLVALLMSEPRPLGADEQRETLRQRFSYFDDDLVVVLWDASFVYENEEDAHVVEDILEFANSQLVECRTYDARLDAELDAIYAMDTQRRAPYGPMRRRAAERRAEQLGYLLVDIRELADRASNALKIIGDAYYARVYRGIAARLSLDDWQRQIDSKLDSVGEVYRYLVDQAQTARSEFLEFIVIALIAIEIVVGILGLRH